MCFDAVWKIFPVSWRQFWITPFLTFMVMASFRTFRRSAVIPRTELMNTIDSFNLRYFSWPQVSVNFRYQAKTSKWFELWRNRSEFDRATILIDFVALFLLCGRQIVSNGSLVGSWCIINRFTGVWSKMSALTQRAMVIEILCAE